MEQELKFYKEKTRNLEVMVERQQLLLEHNQELVKKLLTLINPKLKVEKE